MGGAVRITRIGRGRRKRHWWSGRAAPPAAGASREWHGNPGGASQVSSERLRCARSSETSLTEVDPLRTITRLALALGCAAALSACRQSAAPAPTAPAAPSVDVVELSAADARDRMAAGSLTARALTDAYLDRIARIDDDGPRLNAVIELNPNARADADALDAERRAGKVRGPLHGIPVLLKDNIDTAEADDTRPARWRWRRTARPRRLHRRAAARRRRGDPRQDEPQRVGQLPIDAFDVRLERARRADAQSLRARSQSLRLQFGHRRGDRRKSRGDRRRHRDRRLASSARRRCAAWSASKPTVGLVSRSGIIPIS